ncbi:hypothetical protein KAU86_03010 [bacterium]|nr:hypothetical protein [bacterium]
MSGVSIPVIKVEGRTVPEVWEKAVLATWEKGLAIRTEYDREGDPPSRDCTMIMVIQEPMAEPRIHRAFPGGLEDLEVYRQEVINGVHDHWIKPDEGKWTYTYHQRLFKYEMEGKKIDQINYIIDKLAKIPYSRRAQAITWNVQSDPPASDPPCLQRLFFRISRRADGKAILNMNSHWRSRDGYKAAFMNLFVFTDMQRILAEKLGEKLREEVLVGRHVDITDSFHIYGSYYQEFKKFLETLKKRSFRERTWTTQSAEPFFEEGRRRLAKENIP